MSFFEDFLQRQASPQSLGAQLLNQQAILQQVGGAFVRVQSLADVAQEIGELQYRAVDASGKLRMIMSAIDLFETYGIHAHLAGFDLNGTPQFYVSADDGKLLAGGGAVLLDANGITMPDAGDAITFFDSQNNQYGVISLTPETGITQKTLKLQTFILDSVSSLISNGNFETGDFTGWTETDPGGHISISGNGEGYQGGYAAKFTNATTSDYLSQTFPVATSGVVVKIKIKCSGLSNLIAVGAVTLILDEIPATGGKWVTFYLPLPGSTTSVSLKLTSTSSVSYMDDVEVLPLETAFPELLSSLAIGGGTIQIKANVMQVEAINGDNLIYASKSLIHLNGDNANTDVAVHGDTDANLLYTDASTDRVGIGTNAPSRKLDVNGTAKVASLVWNGWQEMLETWTFASADDPVYQIYVSGNITSNPDYQLGNKVKCTNNSTTFYGIIVKIGSYDAGNNRTPVDIYGGTDYDLANSAITAPYLSKVKAPDGFPPNPDKWSVVTSNTTTYTKTSPAQNTWYNSMDSGSLPTIVLPIGVWRVAYRGNLRAATTVDDFANANISLSTANNSESDAEFTAINSINAGKDSGGNLIINKFVSMFPKILALTAKTTYYLVIRTTAPTAGSLQVQGASAATVIKAVCAYL